MPRVRWVGHRQRLLHKKDRDGYGFYDSEGNPVLEVDYKYEDRREVPWIGFTQREVGPDNVPGLSTTYQWGPGEGTFTVDMTEADWAILQAAWNDETRPLPFAEVGDDDDGGRRPTSGRAIALARS